VSSKILQPVTAVSGRAVAIHGNDIDTDRIIPARYMKVVTFDGLEQFAFRDERFAPNGSRKAHPFNEEARQGAAVMVVNANFGCGSSREHAPQSLVRWGIRGIVGEGFAEIFFGNCVTLGVPCVTLPHEAVVDLQRRVDADPSLEVEIDVANLEVRAGDFRASCRLPDGPRSQFLAGTWDALAVLLEAGDAIDATARRLPYIAGF
jgi:3-isopropylmalate/(R)-2-methylmalate dehydratase small subunit